MCIRDSHYCFLLLQVLRWFTSLGLLLPPYFIQMVIHEFCSCGFPHSDICGSQDECSLPQLFAACHVLHRLEVPRHPPCALSSLTIKFTQNNKRTYRVGWTHKTYVIPVTYRRLHSKTCLVCFFTI